MKKKTKILIGCIIAVIILAIVGVVYISSRLPDGFGIDKFAKGVIATDIKNEPFVELSPNEFFLKEGNLQAVIDHLDDRSIVFVDQIGTLIFTYEGRTVKGELEPITRWHRVLILDLE